MSKELLHIVYLSKAKLDLYYPQIPARFLAGASAKITLHIGVADLELGATHTEPSEDVARLTTLVHYLEDNDLLGSETELKPFVRGVVTASALLDGSHIFFGGTLPGPDSAVRLCLCASTKHMIGYEPGVENDQSRRNIGSVRVSPFNYNSNNWQFGDRLLVLARTTTLLTGSDKSIRRSFSAIEFLEPEERSSYSRFKFLNPLVRFLGSYDFSLSIMEILATAIFGPVFFILLGPGGRRKKLSAIAKMRYAQKYADDSEKTTDRQQNIIDSAAVVGRDFESGSQEYEFVARRLLQGFTSHGERVLFASPLYMATTDRFAIA